MSTVLLLIIYLIFISLGLPDSFIGSSWPSISQSLGVSESLQGVLNIVISFFTILTSFFTIKLIKIFKEKGVVIISIMLTCTGLICSAYASNFALLCLSIIPLGIGAGAIDSTLNNYVALHYKAIHLNWLHAFWGVGATLSPFLLSFFLTDLNGWRDGALCLAIIQSVIFLITLCTVKVWNYAEQSFTSRDSIKEEVHAITLGFFETFKIKGVAFAIIAFFCYIAIEGLTGNWFASMIVFGLGVDEATAARWSSYFYLGIMTGRIASGLISLKVNDKNMIRIGEGIVLGGVIMLMMNFNIKIMPFAVVIIGLGCAPIYPSIVHATPDRFTRELSQNVMSMQIGFAYIASLVIVPLFGVFGEQISFIYLPYLILFFLAILTVCNEVTLVKTRNKKELFKKKIS